MGRRRRGNRIPQEPVEVVIESLSHEGKGVAHHNDKVMFVSGALAGERVLAKYIKVQRRHDEAMVHEVLEASSDRIDPQCKQFGVCGGCSLQHLSSENQIAVKQTALIDTLKHVGKVEPDSILPALMNDSPWGYRRKARLGVKYVTKKDKVLVGFRERGTSFITDTEVCHVLHPSVGLLITLLSSLIYNLSIKDKIPQIEVAIDDHQCILVFRILEDLTQDDKDSLLSFGKEHEVIIYTQSGGPATIKPLMGEPVVLSYELPEYSVNNQFLPTDFTQVNTDINKKMISLAMKLLDVQSTDKVLDLFCGLGNFTLPIATKAAEVIGVEGDQDLVSRAKENALSNNINNTRYFLTDLYESVDQQIWNGETFDKVLLDPPRSGAFEIVKMIDKFNASRIVYVSCYPATLARDLDVLVNEKGYKLESAGVMDMFPHTSHVESIALLTKNI